MGWNDHLDPNAINSDSRNYVCADCVNDPALAAVVKSHAEACTCSYCSETTTEPSCAPIQTLIDHMVEAIYGGYTEVENELNLSQLKAGAGYDSDDLLNEIQFDPKEPELRQEIVDALGDRQWCERDYYSLSDVEAMQFGWKDFKKTIKHQRRFTFHTLIDPDPDDQEVPPVGHPALVSAAQPTVVVEVRGVSDAVLSRLLSRWWEPLLADFCDLWIKFSKLTRTGNGVNHDRTHLVIGAGNFTGHVNNIDARCRSSSLGRTGINRVAFRLIPFMTELPSTQTLRSRR